MVGLRETVQRFGHRRNRIAICILTAIALLPPVPACGKPVQEQSQRPTASATLQGSVRDSRGHPVAAATVYLRPKSGTKTVTARTDSEGSYRFSELSEGIYTLRAEMAGYDEASFGP